VPAIRTLRTDAIILRRTNFGEADRILKVITPGDGILSIMAKAVRREKSKLAGGIELFAVCDLNLHFGRGDLAILTGARARKFYANIMGDYDRLSFGYEILKTVSRMADGVDAPEFYELTNAGLAALDDENTPLNVVEAWFYLKTGELAGGALNTATDVEGMKLVEDARYDYDPGAGAFRFSENGAFGADEIKFLRLAIHNGPEILAKIAGAERLAATALPAAKAVAKI
jgi:DNA repair protein RecO (recombination protein O)